MEPLAIGQLSVATDQANKAALRQAVETAGFDGVVVADKGMAVAVPVGVDKASGLAAAPAELELSPHNVVGVGHAVSDLEFLDRCECGVAVANAPPEVADRCDLVTSEPAGPGLVELIDQLVADDLASAEPRLVRRWLLLGHDDGGELAVPAYGANLLLAGPSGAGKSTLAAGCWSGCVTTVTSSWSWTRREITPTSTGWPTLAAGTIPRRPSSWLRRSGRILSGRWWPTCWAVGWRTWLGFLRELLRGLQELRTRTGRPHLLMLDEAHHFLPLPGGPAAFVLPRWADGLLMATVNPEHVSPTALSLADMVVTFGDAASSALDRYCQAIGEPAPGQAPAEVPTGQALAFHRTGGAGWSSSRSPAGRPSVDRICAAMPRASWMRPRASTSVARTGGCGYGPKPWPCSSSSPREWTTPPGCTTYARATTRPGS